VSQIPTFDDDTVLLGSNDSQDPVVWDVVQMLLDELVEMEEEEEFSRRDTRNRGTAVIRLSRVRQPIND
jgi:hypothetical protein